MYSKFKKRIDSRAKMTAKMEVKNRNKRTHAEGEIFFVFKT